MSEIKEILINLGYSNITEDTKNFRMKPVYRDSSSNTVLSVRKDTGRFIDFSKQISGSLQDLVKLSLSCSSEDEALKWLKDNGASGSVDSTQIKTAEIKEPKIFSKTSLEKMMPHHDYWVDRGVSEDTLALFGGGVVYEGKMKNRYVFPIYDYKNNLVGVSGRDLVNDPESKRPKWKHIGDKGQWKYPMQVNNKIIRKAKKIIVVESIGDMLSLWEAGIKNVAVSFGLQIGLGLINYFLRIDAQKIYLAFNNDDEKNSAGNQAAEKNLNRLTRYFDQEQIEIALPDEGDFGEMSVEQILEWKSKKYG
tara:strand:+ start:27675 stop:28595 length:921 start_codon:yes stop_codon:yes gene_type:complete